MNFFHCMREKPWCQKQSSTSNSCFDRIDFSLFFTCFFVIVIVGKQSLIMAAVEYIHYEPLFLFLGL